LRRGDPSAYHRRMASEATPAVSVIIPTYDRLEFLKESAASVLAQTFTDFELIVVDDGSTDSTAQYLQELSSEDRRVRWLTGPNLGVSAARNRGARAARAPMLAFLDSDDLWEPQKLERQLHHMAAQPHVRASYTEETWIRRGRFANPCNHHAKHDGDIFEACLALCIISPSSVMLERTLYDELGGFDESLPACEDYDLWLRLSAREAVLLVDERLIIKRNGHAGQLSQEYWGLDRFRVRALWKLLFDEEVDADRRKLAAETLAKKAAVVAQGARKRGNAERAAVFEHSARHASKLAARL